MPMKFYSAYNVRSSINRSLIKEHTTNDSMDVDKRETANDGVGRGEGKINGGGSGWKAGDSVCYIMSSTSFRYVICVIIVLVLVLYKTVYMNYLYLKNGVKSSTPITDVNSWNAIYTTQGNGGDRPPIEVVEILPNCGLQTICSDNAFPVHIYTGKNMTDFPKLCIMGKYVVSFNRTVGGRGINIALVEPTTYTIVVVKNFDTYEYSSSNMDEWLSTTMKDGYVAIFFTFDEASKKLTKSTRNVLYEIGSGKIQDLTYRCQWYMVTQKGIRGITPYEKITYSHRNMWAEPLDDKLCVPFQITGNAVVVDDLTNDRESLFQLCNMTSRWATTDDQSIYCNESNDGGLANGVYPSVSNYDYPTV
ncbi:protein FAM3C-like [Adelges cooleyi]|uniref:protein FAM3C-like n=1 Tax=Adelges cooleyi TaxID=133065 RepID=UPI00217F9A08|nr:protein FAM3C-like [Adelges cooleyi]